MKVFLAALILIGAGVFGMCFNILFRRKDFPQSDVGANEEMRKKGIRCMAEIDAELFSSKRSRRIDKPAACSGDYTDACASCAFYTLENKSKTN